MTRPLIAITVAFSLAVAAVVNVVAIHFLLTVVSVQ